MTRTVSAGATICCFVLFAAAIAAEGQACHSNSDPTCEAAHVGGTDAKFADISIEELAVQLVQKKSTSKRSESQSRGVLGQTSNFSQGIDCCDLPVSMQGSSKPSGCPGAVWSSGSPASGYCSGSSGKYPWWAQCCEFTSADGCVAKAGACVPTTSTTSVPLGIDCCDLPVSMQGSSKPSGCPGAVWSSGSPASGYCSGSSGKYPWWAQCCEFTSADGCVAKAGACVPTTTGAPASTTAAAAPGWYLSGVDQSCTAGCAAQGLQCFESQLQANNGDVDSSAEVQALITQLGGAPTTAAPSNPLLLRLIEEFKQAPCSDRHGSKPDVPSFGPSWCFYSSSQRTLSSFDCDQVPVPANENKQRLCYCASNEAPTAAPSVPPTAAPP